MTMLTTTAPKTQAIKVKKSDWRKIPAYCKSLIGGVPKVLTKKGFMPVEIVQA